MLGFRRPGSKYAFMTSVFDGVIRTPEQGRRDESAIASLWDNWLQTACGWGRSKVGNGAGGSCSFAHSSSGVFLQLKNVWRTSEA